MPPAMNLTEGVIAMLSDGDQGGMEVKPVLQVADVRLVNAQNPSNNAVERYRVVLSDGIHLQQGMLATQRNDLVRSQKLQKGSVVQLTQFVCNLIQNRRIIIIVDLDVILESCDTIGEPKPYTPKLDSSASSVGAPSSAVHPMNQPPRTLPSSVPMPNLAAPMPNLAGGTRVQPSEMHGSNIGSNAHTSSFAANHDSERHNTTAPMYGRTETGTGISGAPMNSYSRQPHAVYQQPSPVYMNRGPISKNEAAPKITPIIALNPYQGRWTIKARVTSKTELRLYNNQRGDGKVFSFDLLDSSGGEIRATCFNAVAAQFYDQIEFGKVYMISKGTLKPAQKKFNHLNNDYEISLDSNSTIQPCSEDDNSIPQQQFHFRPISDIEGMENNTIFDVIGIVSSISPCSTIMTKNGTETQRRNLQLKDMSGRSVELTLWGNFSNAEGQTLQNMCDSGIFPVLAVKSCRVNDFNGKALGTISASQLLIEPKFKESYNLKAWFDKDGKNTPSVSLSRDMTSMVRPDVRKSVSQIKDERLGTSEKPDWITICGTVTFVRAENFCYTACPLRIGDRQCSKKVTNNGDGKWRCERCDQTVDECDYRYVLQLQIQDHSGLAWVTSFQESGEEIMGISAKELYLLKYEAQDDERFAEILRNVLFTKYVFKLKVKEETYSDEQRVKSTVIKAEKINFPSETRNLLELMDKMKMEDSGSLPMKPENSKPNTDLNHPGFGGRSKEPVATIPNYVGGASSAVRDSGVHGNQGSSYGSQYGGPGLVSASSASMHSSCNSCGGTGHTSANCPAIMSAQGRPYGGGYGNSTAAPAVNAGNTSTECYKCHEFGHWAKDCPALNNGPPSANAGNASTECYKCHQFGHWAKDCPASNNGPPSANAGNTSTECYKCHQFGHWAKDCPGTNAPPAYGMGNSTMGRYGNVSRQGVGGF